MSFWCQSCGEQRTQPHVTSANITTCAKCGGSHFATWKPVRQSLSQEAVRDEALPEWLDLPALMRERIVDALVPTVDADGCYEPEEIYEAIRCITSDPALKREPNAAARSDLLQVTRAFLESLRCPDPNCADGWITNAGPDPQHDSCPWCEARNRFLAGDLPTPPGASDD